MSESWNSCGFADAESGPLPWLYADCRSIAASCSKSFSSMLVNHAALMASDGRGYCRGMGVADESLAWDISCVWVISALKSPEVKNWFRAAMSKSKGKVLNSVAESGLITVSCTLRNDGD